jgi:CpeT protein
MINDFYRLIEGKFENQFQAFSNPSKYAYIRITHLNIGNGLIYGQQSYYYDLDRPYRQFVLQPKQEDDKIRILNYKIKCPSIFVNFRNLDTLSLNDIELNPGCDVILEKDSDTFKGGLTGCDCMVDWMGRQTYLQNEIELTPTHYYVMDRGFCAQHGHQLWGSKYGRFEFARMPD